MRVGFLGPAGTYSEEAVLAGTGTAAIERVPLPSVHAAVAAVREG
ncbi:MAG: Prephenate dehydratase, partial [Solirubrobacteraceae bacterium]|nr:Prephenate dehydratase [Solirubrobacteraceae bacterium]